MDSNQIFTLISKVRQHSSAFIEREMGNLGMEGLLSSHGAIFGALMRNNGTMRMSEIADKTEREKSTITYLVNRLHQHGYVTREKGKEDSRETYITLTGKAWAMKDNFHLVSKSLLEKAYAGFSEDEKQTLFTLLKRLDDNFLD